MALIKDVLYMRFKRVVAAALVTASLTAALPVLPVSAAPLSVFPDITDAAVAEAAEFLRAMEVVGGMPGGSYAPNGTLTRAEFCKMAIHALGMADREPANRGRTIYLDVGPAHWARGYINLAATCTLGDEKSPSPLVTGLGDGTFRPDRPITYAEAVTILCRVLGFGVADVSTGGRWYDGYLDVAAASGLTDGLTNDPNAPINRGQAAILFFNLFFADPKGEDTSYLEKLGGSLIPDSILLDGNAKDGTAVITNQGTYPSRRSVSAAYEGLRGSLVLDENKEVITFLPERNTTHNTVHIRSAAQDSVITIEGKTIYIAPETKLYVGDQVTTWQKGFIEAKPYAGLTFHYASGGALAYLYLSTGLEGSGVNAMIAMEKPNPHVDPFSSLARDDDYILLRNGEPAKPSDIQQYDVAVYDPAAHIMSVSDLRISGAITDFEPQTGLPEIPSEATAVTVMGSTFKLLPDARKSLAQFHRNSQVTLLLTADLQVAGVVPAREVPANASGMLHLEGSPQSDPEDDSGDSSAPVSIKLMPSGVTLKGTGVMDQSSFTEGQFVSIGSSWAYTDDSGEFREVMHLKALPRTRPAGELNIADRTIGGKKLADSAQIFDQYYGSDLVPVPYDRLTGDIIPASRISTVYLNDTGRIQYVILKDGTGDLWEYGILHYFPGVPAQNIEAHWKLNHADDKGGSIFRPVNANGERMPDSSTIKSGVPCGIFVGKGEMNDIVRYQELKSIQGVPRASFNAADMTLKANGKTFPIAQNVQIYDNAAQTWFVPGVEGLNAARVKAQKLNVFYDRPVSEGGKIRIVTIN